MQLRVLPIPSNQPYSPSGSGKNGSFEDSTPKHPSSHTGTECSCKLLSWAAWEDAKASQPSLIPVAKAAGFLSFLTWTFTTQTKHGSRAEGSSSAQAGSA